MRGIKIAMDKGAYTLWIKCYSKRPLQKNNYLTTYFTKHIIKSCTKLPTLYYKNTCICTHKCTKFSHVEYVDSTYHVWVLYYSCEIISIIMCANIYVNSIIIKYNFFFNLLFFYSQIHNPKMEVSDTNSKGVFRSII